MFAIARSDAGAVWDLLRVPAWHSDAACKEHRELDWFPGSGDDIVAPMTVCAGCLVREECLAAALARNEPDGIWGGLTTRERRRQRRKSLSPLVVTGCSFIPKAWSSWQSWP